MHTQRFMLIMVIPLLFAGIACGQGAVTPMPQDAKKESPRSARTGFLGVSTQDLTPALAEELNINTRTGARVIDVVEGSPAEKAGIKEDDVIIEFNGATVADADDLIEVVRKSGPGSAATVVVVRDNQKKKLQATLGKMPRQHAFAVPPVPHVPPFNVRVIGGHGAHGLHLMDLNPQLGEYFSAPQGKGVLVEKVEKRSAAKDAGFKAGDVILRVGKNEVEDIDDVWEALDGVEEGDSAAIDILRKGARLTLALEIDEAGEMGSFQFRSPKWDHRDDDMRIFKLDRLNLEKNMQQLQEELRGMGREIRSRVDMLRNKLNRELRQVKS